MQITRAILKAAHKLLSAREEAAQAIGLMKSKFLNGEFSYHSQQLLVDSVLSAEKAEYDAEQTFIKASRKLNLPEFDESDYIELQHNFEARKLYIGLLLRWIQKAIQELKQAGAEYELY